MAHVYADLVAQNTETTGTGSYALTTAVANRRAFGAVLSNGDTTDYQVTGVDASGTAAWEVGVGTYATSGATLARTTIRASSTGSAINWGPGAKTVTMVQAAGSMVARSPDGTLSLPYTTYVGGGAGAESLRVIPITGANRCVTMTGSNGGDPTIGTSAGNLNLYPASGVVYIGGVSSPYLSAYDGTRFVNFGVDSTNTTKSAFLNSSNGARFLASSGTVSALSYDSSGNLFSGSRGSAVSAERLHISPVAAASTGAAEYLAVSNSGSGDGSPNVAYFGIDGAALSGVAFFDTGSFGVAGPTPIELRTGGTAQVRIIPTASANRCITLAGSNGGSPTISTNAGHLFLTSVGGGVIITNSGSDPSSPQNGMLYYNNATNKFRGYAGGTWVDLH